MVESGLHLAPLFHHISHFAIQRTKSIAILANVSPKLFDYNMRCNAQHGQGGGPSEEGKEEKAQPVRECFSQEFEG